MASSPKHARDDPQTNRLAEELSQALPKDIHFNIFHLSTPPTISDALCCTPAKRQTADNPKDVRPTKPLKTYCEKHFLSVSINAKESGDDQVLVVGVEVFIFTTSHSTTIFVSKADSTGYLSLLNLPKGTPSPIREIAAVFVNFLVAARKRPSKQLVVNLFARAQDQYLFPGSIKNKNKHVLDDRGLVKWWCRVLNPMLEEQSDESKGNKSHKNWSRIHGYLTIPGLDHYETRAFLPRTPSATNNWTIGDPLARISPYVSNPDVYGPKIPPRCLIPMFPDDPKARFVQELEEVTPQKVRLRDGWKAPRTLDDFWEMLSFRQECSSGRMTSFVWIVFDPRSGARETKPAVGIPTPSASFTTGPDGTARPSTPPSATSKVVAVTPKKPRKSKPRKTKKTSHLTGRIVSRQPQVKTQNRIKLPDRIETPYYYWPEEGRGRVLLDENGYKRAVELLLHLEFSNLDSAVASTTRWTKEVNLGEKWGLDIVGRRVALLSTISSTSSTGTVNSLSAGLVRRKRPADDVSKEATTPSEPVANTLGAGLVRKKIKTDDDEGGKSEPSPS